MELRRAGCVPVHLSDAVASPAWHPANGYRLESNRMRPWICRCRPQPWPSEPPDRLSHERDAYARRRGRARVTVATESFADLVEPTFERRDSPAAARLGESKPDQPPARSSSPAAMAWSIARSGSEWAAYQRLARAWIPASASRALADEARTGACRQRGGDSDTGVFSIQRDDQGVRSRQVAQLARGAGPLQHFVAERAGELVEHGAAGRGS